MPLTALLHSCGMSAHAFGVGQAASFLGCLLLAAAAVGTWNIFQTGDSKLST